MRGATPFGIMFFAKDAYFNPHSPCGERLLLSDQEQITVIFQSTLPMRGATTVYEDSYDTSYISIHTPHAGSDPYADYLNDIYGGISIHTPHAGSDNGLP